MQQLTLTTDRHFRRTVLPAMDCMVESQGISRPEVLRQSVYSFFGRDYPRLDVTDRYDVPPFPAHRMTDKLYDNFIFASVDDDLDNYLNNLTLELCEMGAGINFENNYQNIIMACVQRYVSA
jgi:hypothetical protein